MSYGFRVFSAYHRAIVGNSQSGMSKSLALFLNALLRRKEVKVSKTQQTTEYQQIQ